VIMLPMDRSLFGELRRALTDTPWWLRFIVMTVAFVMVFYYSRFGCKADDGRH
jgi:hypothetical protein